MNIYGYFNENINSHVVEINECETLTDEIVKSARTFISNAIKWDSGAYRPVADALHKRLLNDIYKAEYEVEYEKRYQWPDATNSYEYGNEIAHREADRLACKLVDELKDENIERLYNILKGYRQ
jgi:hypothetical protein|uniref:Uncharacterized protein n=2 Tax=unclassified Caudoviricetes TaxID=2788787 RepID=A0A8S5PFT8_9CAUD|nr:MAG TPA: hypothetical protein [Caudovirales sp. ctbaM10]DAE15785.1 MAG TPA: hypothetical protein [Caudovirales sp. ctIyl37]DAJ43475.1 MAG TPA: hypothetical protein [Caudoviricetes sp.]